MFEMRLKFRLMWI